MLEVGNIEALAARETPFYYYDMDLFTATVDKVAAIACSYGINVHYAVKANVQPKLLAYMASKGFGADCVSGNEVLLAAANGFAPGKIMFAGVGKTDKEIENALKTGIEAFNVESVPELENINAIAGRMGVVAQVQFRVNPNIDAHTHKYITTGLKENKFGLTVPMFPDLVEALGRCSNVKFVGIQAHIGSQITVLEPFVEECARMNAAADWFEAAGYPVKNIDLGGGLGIDYEHPTTNPVAPFETWMKAIADNIDRKNGRQIHIEPGRSLVGQCGSLITKVLYVKKGENKSFLITDAGMNDLIRPALYGSYHKVENLTAGYRGATEKRAYDVVGPVCESSDVWGEDRMLPESLRGDVLAIRSAGAYGQVMASRYNCKDFAPAVFSDEL